MRFSKAERDEVRKKLAQEWKMSDIPDVTWSFINYPEAKDIIDDEVGLHLLDRTDAGADVDAAERAWKEFIKGTERFLRSAKIERKRYMATSYSSSGTDYGPGHDATQEHGMNRSQVGPLWLNASSNAYPEDYSNAYPGANSVLTKDDEELLKALWVIEATSAATLPPVVRFRQEYLRGNLLSEDEFLAFVSSPALRLFSLTQLQEWGMDPLSQNSLFVTTEFRYAGELVEWAVRFKPGGRLERVRFHPNSLTDLNWLLCHEWDANGEDCGPIQVLPGSVLDEVRRLTLLLEDFYLWNAYQALFFLLTGERMDAPMPQVEASYQSYTMHLPTDEAPLRIVSMPGTITLRVPTALSAKTVSNLFRKMQTLELGREVHPIHARNLALFRFVREKQGAGGLADHKGRPKWTQLCCEWNQAVQQYEGWEFKERPIAEDKKSVRSARSQFMEQYRRTEALLLRSRGECRGRRDDALVFASIADLESYIPHAPRPLLKMRG